LTAGGAPIQYPPVQTANVKGTCVRKKPAAAPVRLFGEKVPGPDETNFQVDNVSDEYYSSPYYLVHHLQLQPVPAPRVSPPEMELADVLSADRIAAIEQAKRISFHAVGDTGAAPDRPTDVPSTLLGHEASVADAMSADVANGGPDAPAFFFHLGDIIYHFGEAQYYYDQFYEPFRGYDAPIFAIPGNHDGVVYGLTSTTPAIPTLAAYLNNFCATTPGPSPDSGALVRTTMDQPGVYFALDAPFVSIIGLYTNTLEGPGVISSQGGKYPIGDEQVAFLQAQLTRLKPEREANQRAIVLACHHPPVSIDIKHGGTVGVALDIDKACAGAGLYPDAVISGHAHLFQRFTRTLPSGQQIPYVTAGSGGFGLTAAKNVAVGTVNGEYTLAAAPIFEFGYLTLTADMSGATPHLTIAFRTTLGGTGSDSVTVHLATGKIA
jgi:hypothetical protein